MTKAPKKAAPAVEPPVEPPVEAVQPEAEGPDPSTLTLGELFGVPPVPPVAAPPPGFAMQDEPFEDPRLRTPLEGINPPDPADAHTQPGQVAQPPAPNPAVATAITSSITPADADFSRPADAPRWMARINVLEAFQYQGNLIHAPMWVDRNWIAWGDADPLRGLPAGSVLRVPLGPNPNDGEVLCRVGDYLVRQEFLFEDGRPSHLQTEVWARENFERTFMKAPPLKSSPQQTPSTAAASRDAA